MEKKFYFDANIFDAPQKDEVPADLPPPPPTYSEEELSAAKDISGEQGRQLGQRQEKESREQVVAQTLGVIAENFSHLFAAETLRENVFEKEALKLSVAALDLLFPLLNEKIGRDEVYKVIQKTLTDHRKTKEIKISVPAGFKGEIEALISRIRANEHEDVLWRVSEDAGLSPGDCRLEWGDGGAVRDSERTARDIRRNIEALFGQSLPRIVDLNDSDMANSDVLSKEKNESADVEGDEQ